MATLHEGLRLWAGGSLVSGDITDGGASAEGSATEWQPPYPYSNASMPSADGTFVDLQPDGRGWDAVSIMAVLGGTPSDDEAFIVSLNIWVALLFPLSGASGSTATYRPEIIQLTWSSQAAASRQWAADVGPFPSEGWVLNGATSDITAIFRPLVYPRNNVQADGANIGANGFARESVISPQSSNRTIGIYTLPLCGAAGAVYRVNNLQVEDSDWADVDLRLGYSLLRSNL